MLRNQKRIDDVQARMQKAMRDWYSRD